MELNNITQYQKNNKKKTHEGCKHRFDSGAQQPSKQLDTWMESSMTVTWKTFFKTGLIFFLNLQSFTIFFLK